MTFRKLLFLNSLIICYFSFGQDGANDSSFNINDFGVGTAANDWVENVVAQSDGKIIVAGKFTSYNGLSSKKYIVRLNPNGIIDDTFNPGIYPYIYATAIQDDGKIIVGGAFNYSFNDSINKKVVRLHSDGSIDMSFNVGRGADEVVRDIIIQPDGKIIVVGEFNSFNNNNLKKIVRLNTDGSIDLSFNPGLGADDNIYDVAVQSDGKMIVVGSFNFFDNNPSSKIARLNSDGSFDNSFNIGLGADSVIYSIAIQSNEKIIIGGVFNSFDGNPSSMISRLNMDGSFDSSFNIGLGANLGILSITIQSNDKIIVGGGFSSFDGIQFNKITRLHSDGSVDNLFNTGPAGFDTFFDGPVKTCLIQPDGKIIIGGDFMTFDTKFVNRIIRLEENGSIDPIFYPETGANNTVSTLTLQNDGRVLIGGAATVYNGVSLSGFTRINPDGSRDISFQSPELPQYTFINHSAVQPDGKIIVTGSFDTINNIPMNGIARLNSNGAIDSSFIIGSGFNELVHNIIIQPDGKIIITGRFSMYNGIARNRIARLNNDGTLDLSFSTSPGADNDIYAISVQPDGKIIVAGDFYSYNNIEKRKIARLNSDGSLDINFNPPSINEAITTTLIQPDGKILIGGRFTGSSRKGIRRLNSNGSIDLSFNSITPQNGNNSGAHNVNSQLSVNDIALQLDGKIIIVGTFNAYNGMPSNGIARLNLNGSFDESFSSNANDYVNTCLLFPNGKILIGGKFTSYNGVPRSRIALIENCPAPQFSVDSIFSCDSYVWIDGTTYNNSNNSSFYTYTGGAENGCDSTIVLSLVINEMDTSISISGITLTANQSGATYQWVDCNNGNMPISGATSQSFTPSANGIYAVMLTANTCTETSDCIAVNSVGIESFEKHGWNVYPNPNNGLFTITSTQEFNNTNIEVYSIVGRLIYSTIHSGNKIVIDLKEQPAGVYIVKVKNHNSFRITKF